MQEQFTPEEFEDSDLQEQFTPEEFEDIAWLQEPGGVASLNSIAFNGLNTKFFKEKGFKVFIEEINKIHEAVKRL